MCAAAIPILQFVVPAWGATPIDQPITVLATLSSDADIAIPGAPPPPSPLAMASALAGTLWLTGFVVSVGLLVVGLSRLAWLASRSQPLQDGTWVAAVSDISARYGIRRPVVLLQSNHPTMLVTWGLVVPKVILPAAARGWTPARARIVLGHELAHIQRRDWIVHIAAALLRSVYWFNPLVWIACARLRRESEHACDDAVLNLGVEGTEYATQLVDLARAFNAKGRSWLPGSPAPAMARRSTLERRVRAMLTDGQNRRPITRFAVVAIAAALLAITIPIAGFGAATQTGPATFSGRLLDTIGRMMPDEPIVLTNTVTKAVHAGRSNSSGYFSFAGLEAGDYDLTVQAMGFALRYRVSVTAGQALQRDITLQLGSLEETINIIKDGSPSVPRPSARVSVAPYVRQPGPCDQSLKGGCIEPPTKIADKRPRYPDNRSESEVKVILECRIGTDGVPFRVRVIGPADADFAKAAADAVYEWRFTPTYLDGVAVEVDMKVTATFRSQ